jgi:hypothetical protein
MSTSEIERTVRSITKLTQKDEILTTCRVTPFGKEHPPVEVSLLHFVLSTPYSPATIVASYTRFNCLDRATTSLLAFRRCLKGDQYPKLRRNPKRLRTRKETRGLWMTKRCQSLRLLKPRLLQRILKMKLLPRGKGGNLRFTKIPATRILPHRCLWSR